MKDIAIVERRSFIVNMDGQTLDTSLPSDLSKIVQHWSKPNVLAEYMALCRIGAVVDVMRLMTPEEHVPVLSAKWAMSSLLSNGQGRAVIEFLDAMKPQQRDRIFDAAPETKDLLIDWAKRTALTDSIRQSIREHDVAHAVRPVERKLVGIHSSRRQSSLPSRRP